MNFVLHLHLAARDLASPTAGAGAMLPDLWRMADRRVRAQQRAPELAAPDPELETVLAGIAHHLAVDRWFHADDVFAEGERDASRLLSEARIAAPRTVLFAHVLWELCLDGALLRREGFDAVLALLRRGVLALRPVVRARAADLHHFDRVPRSASDRASFDARLDRILLELARGPWIEGYQTGAGIADRLSGVRRSLGLSPYEGEDRARLAAVADALLARASPVVEAIEGSTRARESF